MTRRDETDSSAPQAAEDGGPGEITMSAKGNPGDGVSRDHHGHGRRSRLQKGDWPPKLKLGHILLLSLSLRLITLLTLILLSHYIPAFDASHQLLTSSSLHRINSPENSSSDVPSMPSTLRWDAVHFTGVALGGYEYEQHLAFMPFFLALMRYAGRGVALITRASPVGVEEVVWGGVSVNIAATLGSTTILYKLTEQLASEPFAKITTLLYILSPTPAVLASAYTEPTYALFTFLGFYLIVRHRRFLLGAISLALATGTRATGVFSAVVLGWSLVFPAGIPRPVDLRVKRLLLRLTSATFLSVVVVSPFLAMQYHAYKVFCVPEGTRPWCNARFPSVYSFVQGEYWNVGLFKYWTVAQVPNLVLALPVLIPSLWGTYRYLVIVPPKLLASLRGSISSSDQGPASTSLDRRASTGRDRDLGTSKRTGFPMDHPLLLPLHLHHLFLTLLLIFSSHTQIALRVASTDPVVWWNIASLSFDWNAIDPIHDGDAALERKARPTESGPRMTRFGWSWLTFTIVYGGMSLVLWSAHLPPA